jgi:dolichyl-phosphate beta-glucosyltransferase
MSEVYLSVIVPAYNEEQNFTKGKLEGLFNYLEKRSYAYEIIFVDDGSDDNTLGKLHELKRHKKYVSVINNPHKGKALTVMTGLKAAEGTYRLFTDFDQSTDISEVEKLLPFTRKGYEVVIGSREVKGAFRGNEPWYRHVMGRGFNTIVKVLAVWGIQDTQCGFKLISSRAVEQLLPQMKVTVKPRKHAFTGAFDVELLYLAQKNGFKIAEVPVHWEHEESERVNPIKDSFRMLQEVMKIRLMALSGGYA